MPSSAGRLLVCLLAAASPFARGRAAPPSPQVRVPGVPQVRALRSEEDAAGRLEGCLADIRCLRRLQGDLGDPNSTNITTPAPRSYDLPVMPMDMPRWEAPDQVYNWTAGWGETAAGWEGFVPIALYGDFQGIANGGDPNTGKQVYGNYGLIYILKVAILAYLNGLVIEPPARGYANVTYMFLWADTCQDIETMLTVGSRCSPAFAQRIMQPLISGREEDDPLGYWPKARGLLGGHKWTTSVASLAGAQMLPNMGHFSDARALSDKLVYPSFVRTDPTDVVTFGAFVAVLQLFNFTFFDMLVCDTQTNRASANDFSGVALARGIANSQFLIPPAAYTLWPAGGEHDDPIGYPHDPDRTVSLLKKMRWDTAIAGMRASNAHAHADMMDSECPEMDVMHYFALHGLAGGGGHMWFGRPPSLSFKGYEDTYMYGMTYVVPALYHAETPYIYVNPMDNFIFVVGADEGTAKAEFWELMKFIGTHQEYLQAYANTFPLYAYEDPSFYNWQRPNSEYLVDAVFALLFAINDLVLDVGPDFSNEQLLERIHRTDFQGLTGRVQFNADGDRIQKQIVQQYRLPPNTHKLVVGVRGTGTYIVASYLEKLTVEAPFLFTADGGGRKTDPPPDKDLDCGMGKRYDRDGGVCRICLPGTYTSRTGMPQCELCVPGSYAEGNASSSCLPCPQGFAAATAGSTACAACTPGRFNDAVQQADCRQCDPGTFSQEAASVCTFCPTGLYAKGKGNVACVQCDTPLTTRFVGSTGSADCICPAGTYRDASAREVCSPCPDGMVCDLGADAAFFPRILEGNCTGAGDACVIPVAGPKYMTRWEDPLRSYLCLDSGACPGGPPGTCGALRNPDKVACGHCSIGAHKDKKQCVQCKGGVSVTAIVLVLAACVAGLVAAVFLGNRDRILESNSSFSLMVMFGITVSAIQTMGVFRTLALEWFEPLATIFQSLLILSFNVDLLNLECFVQPSAATTYLFRQLAGPFALVVLGAATIVKKWRRPQSDMLVDYGNAIGTVFGAIFISIASSCVLPLICYKHPGRNGESLMNDPTVLCWASRDHTASVIIGGVIFAAVLIPFIAFVAWGTLRHNSFVAQSVRGKGRALMTFRFLFYRFHPHAYFYGSMLMLKGLSICLIPVVIRYDVAFQVCVMCAVLLLAQASQLQLQPWRSVVANMVDGASTGALILFLICGSAGADLSANMESIRLLGSIIFATLCASLLVGFLILLVRWMRPTPFFQWFICHHKRDAGAQARLLKSIFQLSKHTCFIDSDDLKDLDQLFDIVKVAVAHLVVYLTHDVLTRPWCAGEIATTVKKGTVMTAVLTPSWANPSEEEISADGLATYLDLTSTTLHQYSISFENISVAYRHLLSSLVPKIQAAEELCGQARFHSIVGQLLGRSLVEQPSPPCPGMLVVSSDPRDDEATASSGILVSYVQPSLFSFMKEGALLLVDGSVRDDDQMREAVWGARAVTIVLSKNSLQSVEQLKAIAYSMGRLWADKEKKGSGEARLPPYEVIPVTTPTFVFPPPDFYDVTLPKIWKDEEEDITAQDLAVALRSFFKRLAVNFSTHASATVLESQAQHLVDRVPKKWQAGGALEGEIRAQMTTAVRMNSSTVATQSSARTLPKDSLRTDTEPFDNTALVGSAVSADEVLESMLDARV